jgi:hypothetical protein
MNRHKAEENADMTDRLRQLEQLLAPTIVVPRSPADDAIEMLPPLLDVERHMGRMYVAGHEPHFRPVTLLQHVRRPDDPELD